MGKIKLTAGTLLSPLPAVLVTCGDENSSNIITVAWTGIICTKPPMTYISVRPERFSHSVISEKKEFAINLTTSSMLRETDLCGMKSGKNGDKWKLSGLHKASASEISAPLIEESPLSLECKVREIKRLGSHDMFIADIICIDADEKYLDSKGKINLSQAGMMAYSHGEYFSLGRKLGNFGISVRKSHKNKKRVK